MRYAIVLLTLFLAACSQDIPEKSSEVNVMTKLLPYGSWPSPITAASVVAGSRGLGSLAFDEGYLYWVESRPEEGGRSTIMRWRQGGEAEEILAAPFNARSRVQEYGGRSVLVANGVLWFSNFSDQRLYRFVPGEQPEAVTPEADLRFAGCILDATRQRLICIREDHRVLGEPRNALVSLPLSGVSEGEELFSDSDFVSMASLSSDGRHIAFTSWQHPNMPWDNTSLWSAQFDERGGLSELVLHNTQTSESIINPQWGKESQLYALSDRDNWWKIYQVAGEKFTAIESGLENSEIGGPQWSIGHNYYHLLDNGKILAQVMSGGIESAVVIDPQVSKSKPLELASVSIVDMLQVNEKLYIIHGATDQPTVLLETNMQGSEVSVIRRSSQFKLGATWVPKYKLVNYPSGGGAVAHGIYLPPTNPEIMAPAGTAPPLIVMVHGGPTSVTTPAFKPANLFWTSRGFAILDLNYRGSTGFGREYRQSLYGKWGIADVEDAVAGATWLAEQGLADPERLIIRGGSAGGYTTLAAHAFHNTFAAGASYYGISDLEALADDTHKFESRYLDQVIGPYPERKDLYIARSPINHLEGFKAPLLLLQGLDDPVVPPNQSEMIFEALKAKGIPTAYLAFEGEAHGFRKAENQIRALESELYFYSKVLDFEVAEDLPAIIISGLKQ